MRQWWIVTFLFSTAALAADEKDKLLFAHYMPWFASAEVSGEWGWHWTFGKRNPEQRDADGRREIASHEYPLIGPYDSSDPHLLECHVLQMKLAGIDGVIIDWYGVSDLYDYPTLHKNTQALIPWLKKAGLKFAICYEDQTVGALVKRKKLSSTEAVDQGRADLNWLGKHFFQEEAYQRIDDAPLLLVFGPQYFKEGFKQVTSDLAKGNRPTLYLLPHLKEKAAGDGLFAWPPVIEGGQVAPKQWQAALKKIYQRGVEGEVVIGAAFPSFHDFYKTAGVQKGYGRIASRDGATLRESLKMAVDASPQIVQLTTWNDHGEGTAIEPTEESGYRSLEIIQEFTSAPFNAADLPLPARLYRARKDAKMAGVSEEQERLDTIAELLFQGETDRAAALLGAAPPN